MGLRPLFDDHVARLASEGFTTCAIEPWPGQEDAPLEKRMELPVDLDRVLGDLQAAADVTECQRVGVLGFCMGGMEAFRAAGTGRFHRAVAFYGMIVPPDAWRVTGRDPLDVLQKPDACRTLAILGGKDPYTPAGDIEKLRELSNVETALYPEAEHGFAHAPERPSHRADDASDAVGTRPRFPQVLSAGPSERGGSAARGW
jgi:carboxymethylenebutenolidase